MSLRQYGTSRLNRSHSEADAIPRHAIKTDSSELRRIISAPDFTKLFGPASPDGNGKGARCNVFGHDDQLKVAPKGVAKDHQDIDLLKLRSIAVVKK